MPGEFVDDFLGQFGSFGCGLDNSINGVRIKSVVAHFLPSNATKNPTIDDIRCTEPVVEEFAGVLGNIPQPATSERVVFRASNKDCRAPPARGYREILHPQSHKFGSPAERVVSNGDHRAISLAGEGVRARANQLVTKFVGQAQSLPRSLQFAPQCPPHGNDHRLVRCRDFPFEIAGGLFGSRQAGAVKWRPRPAANRPGRTMRR